ncbi:MAG: hypothetical protein HQ521_13525 [Bacteroidetes bacterium]|nr:hypothetical protein [Bacteroidota bacterium]
MADTSLHALRGHLFDVIERLKDSSDPEADPKDTINIETARAINQTAGQIINSAKVEVAALRLIGEEGEISGMKSSGILRLKE